jgi:hypothetical protein
MYEIAKAIPLNTPLGRDDLTAKLMGSSRDKWASFSSAFIVGTRARTRREVEGVFLPEGV